MKRLFDSDLSYEDLVSILSKMEFRMIGHGYSAYVFGEETVNIVIKIFPPLSVGTADELDFIRKNPFLKYADQISSKWQNTSLIHWLRQKAKFFLAVFQGHGNIEKRESSSELCIRGYERCISKGLMDGLPTRVVPNCFSRLSIKTNPMLKKYLLKPQKIILQQRFNQEDMLLYVLKRLADQNEISECRKFIEKAMEYQIHMWRIGLISTDMSFNIFENLIVLPNMCVQLHDANDVTDSLSPSLWFIREKEKDLDKIFTKLDNKQYPSLLFESDHGSVSETARKLFNILPKNVRDEMIFIFLNKSRSLLSEQIFRQNWNTVN